MPEALKVLIVDDTVTYRQIISSVLADIPDTNIVGTASNGKIALSRIAASPPDLVLLDVSMPVMDGLETLKAIREEYADVDVVMVSGIDRGNANLTMRALSLGALDFIAKPVGGTPEESLALLKKSLGPIVSLVKTRKYSRQARKLSFGESKRTESEQARSFTSFFHPEEEFPRPAPTDSDVPRRPKRIQAVGIGVSTGGPNALQKIIPLLDSGIPVPILAVQHMPPTFTLSLAERLDRDSQVQVEEARDGSIAEPGRMYIAPGGRHMVVRSESGGRSGLGIIDSPPVNSCRPSVDVLFRSMAMVYGGNMLAVILTGMGRDGAAGVGAIRRRGGYCIVQDEATSVVWGMPQAVVEMKDADEILPIDRIARRIMEIVSEGRSR